MPVTSAMVHPEIRQRPNRPCPQAWAMPQSAVAGTNPKLNRKGTGRTGRQISYTIARARYNESATPAMKCIFVIPRQFRTITPCIPACVMPQSGMAVVNPKLDRKDIGRIGSKISYEKAHARYNESANSAMKRIFATARQSDPITPCIPSWAMPQSVSAVINPKLNRKDFRSFRSKISYKIHRASYYMTAKKCQKLDLVTARQLRRSHPQAAQIATG